MGAPFWRVALCAPLKWRGLRWGSTMARQPDFFNRPSKPPTYSSKTTPAAKSSRNHAGCASPTRPTPENIRKTASQRAFLLSKCDPVPKGPLIIFDCAPDLVHPAVIWD
jgi:hypothetical protein